MNRVVALPTIAMLVVAAPAAAADVPAVAVERIVVGVEACRAAAGPERLDAAKLKAAGFPPGTISSRGRAASTSLKIYGNGDGLMLMSATEAKGSCVVMARLKAGSDWSLLNAALNQALGAQPVQSQQGEIFWVIAPHAIQLAATGSREKPSVRVVVAYTATEAK